MEKLLSDITKFSRYSKEGKVQFAEFIKEWSKENLKGFVMRIDSSRFVLDIRGFFIAVLSIINFSAVMFILQNITINEWVTSIVLIVFTFGIQLRLIFLLLAFLLPSNNIILSQIGNGEGNRSRIIICAHYDTKNSFVRKQKGSVRGFFKYNIYAFSRLFTKYVLSGGKLVVPVSVLMYVWWLVPGSTVDTASISQVRQNFIHFAFDMEYFLISYSVFCAILMLIMTLPFPKKLNNPGADDNSSGVVGALEIAKLVNDSKLNADVDIVLFDNEERGLIGSSHFVQRNIKELKRQKTFVINLDCIGRGSDIFILGGKFKKNKICEIIEKVLLIKGNNVRYSDIDFSDHKPFLNNEIAAISIGRYNVKRYLWIKDFPVIDWIHGSEDRVEDVDAEKLEEVVYAVSEGIIHFIGKNMDKRDATG